MNDWILFFAGLAVFLVFSAVLNAVFLGAFTARMKRYLLGRIIGGAIKGTRVDHEATHHALGVLGLNTRSDGSTEKEIERLRPARWQEATARVCYCGIAVGFGLMIYAMVRP